MVAKKKNGPVRPAVSPICRTSRSNSWCFTSYGKTGIEKISAGKTIIENRYRTPKTLAYKKAKK